MRGCVRVRLGGGVGVGGGSRAFLLNIKRERMHSSQPDVLKSSIEPFSRPACAATSAPALP